MVKPSPEWLDEQRSLTRAPAAAYLASLGPGSRRTMHQALRMMAEILAGPGADPMRVRWERVRRPDALRLRAALQDKLAPATANKALSALRGVLRAARDLGLMAEADFQTAASVELVKAKVPGPARPVTQETIAALFDACAASSGAAGHRDAALLAVFLCSGMRRAEAAILDVSDYDPKAGRLHIRGERPENDRIVELPKAARNAVADWLGVRTAQPGPLLLPVDRGGIIRFRRMTDQAIYDIFGRLAARAGEPGLTLRDLRRAYVVSLIRAGKPLEDVQYLVGHASWFTTAAYGSMLEDTGASSYDIQRMPYRRAKGGAS
jgi:integrase